MHVTYTDPKNRLAPIEALAQQGRIDEALVEVQSLVREAPELVDAHNDMAVLYHTKGQFEEAHAAIKQALSLDPYSPNVQRNHVAIQIARGRPGEAARALEPILVKNPRDAEALSLAGDIATVTGRWDDAVAFYEAALIVEPMIAPVVSDKLVAARLARQQLPRT